MTMKRREVLKKIGTYSLLLSGSKLFLTKDLFAGFLKNDILPLDLPYLQNQLLNDSPRAKYWISTQTKNVKCSSCHTDEMATKDFLHSEIIIQCQLCAQNCIIKESERGKCRARINLHGTLKTLVYGRLISSHIDPIEKKPFYHFHPGNQALSIATSGCPLSCKFCQNWEISQSSPEDYNSDYYPPDAIVYSSKIKKVPIIAFTYNEPTVFTEYMLDIAHEAQKEGIKTALISCGFMNKKPLTDMCDILNAIKIDLKGFSKEFYRNVCNAELEPVLRSIKQIAKSNAHLELVNLVVPTLNDSDRIMKEMCKWIINEIGTDVPIHFTRFHPDYKLLNLPPTPIDTLDNARNIAIDHGINYAYVGNVPGHPGNNTYCPSCKTLLIRRTGFFISENKINNGKCPFCNSVIAGVWN